MYILTWMGPFDIKLQMGCKGKKGIVWSKSVAFCWPWFHWKADVGAGQSWYKI